MRNSNIFIQENALKISSAKLRQLCLGLSVFKNHIDYHVYGRVNIHWQLIDSSRHGPLARYVKLRVRMRRECRERFPRHRRWAIPTCITARASRTCRDACRDRQLSVSFEIGGGGKRSRHSRRMRNLQFYVSGKRPIVMFHWDENILRLLICQFYPSYYILCKPHV